MKQDLINKSKLLKIITFNCVIKTTQPKLDKLQDFFDVNKINYKLNE